MATVCSRREYYRSVTLMRTDTEGYTIQVVY